MKTKIVTVTGVFIASQEIHGDDRFKIGALIDVIEPVSLRGPLLVPYKRHNFAYSAGLEIKCRVRFEGDRPVGLHNIQRIERSRETIGSTTRLEKGPIHIVTVTAMYIARKLTSYQGKAITVEVLEVKQPESLVGRLEVPNVRAQMLHLQGHLITCNVHFRGSQPIKLTKPQLANQEEP